MDNNNQNTEIIKQAAKTAVNAAISPLKKYILAAVLAVIPYLLIFIAVVILIATIYFSINDQVTEVLNGAEDIGERVGNAITLYGFKNESQVAEDEEEKFYKTLNIYKEFYKLNDYDLMLVLNTLLFETNYSDKLNFTEDSTNVATETPSNDSVIYNVYNIFLSFTSRMNQGFTNAFLGSSQYKKANKYLAEPVMVISKCHKLTGSDNGEDFKKCYYGYLVAEYNKVVDKAIEKGLVDSEVEEGYLIFDDFSKIDSNFGFVGSDMLDDDLENNEEFKQKFNDFLNSDFMTNFKAMYGITKYIYNPLVYISELTVAGVVKRVGDTFENIAAQLKVAINIYTWGKIAEKQTDDKLWNNKHFFYNGYIVRFLREFYKTEKNFNYTKIDDKAENYQDIINHIKNERQNKKDIADFILDTTDAYFELSYGDEYLKQLKSSNSINMNGSSESKKSIQVKLDGEDTELSFDDYIKLKALTEYGDQIDDALENNNVEKLKLIMTIVRTDAYKSLGIDSSSDLTFTDKTNFSKDVLSLTDSQLSELSTIIQNTRGKIIKDKNNNVLKLSNKQITDMINNVSNDKNYEEDIKEVLGDNIKLSSTAQPLDNIDTVKISSVYGEQRSDGPHNAIDYAVAIGTPIYSISDGVVVDTNNGCANIGYIGSTCGGGFGNRVIVQYENYYIIYAHMQLNSVNVSVGNTISAGQMLGNVGSSGSSDGNHLHLEVRVGSWNKGAPNINPKDIINGVV